MDSYLPRQISQSDCEISSNCGKILFPRYKLCLRYTAGNFNGSPGMRTVAKILRAPAGEHLSNFCEQFEQKPNFASTFKLDGTMGYPCTDCLPKLGSNILCDIEDNTWVLVDMEFLFRYLLEISRVSLPSE